MDAETHRPRWYPYVKTSSSDAFNTVSRSRLLHKAGHIQLWQANPQVGPLTSARCSLFLKEINGPVVLTDLSPDNFMQFTANTTDINDSLLGGKDTFHATQVPGSQRGPNKTKHLASLRPADRTCPCNSWGILQQLQAANIAEDKSVPVFTEPIEQKWYTVFYFCLASGILSRNQCFRTQRRQAGRKLKMYWSLPFWHSIQTGRLRWLGFVLVHHWLCVLGNVDALRSTLTAASNVVITL